MAKMLQLEAQSSNAGSGVQSRRSQLKKKVQLTYNEVAHRSAEGIPALPRIARGVKPHSNGSHPQYAEISELSLD